MKRIFFNLIVVFGLFQSTLQGALSIADHTLLAGANENKIDYVMKALKEGANINAQTEDGDSALHLTSDINIVNFLLANQANPNLLAKFENPKPDMTPLFGALMEENDEKALALINSGANLEIKTAFFVNEKPMNLTPLQKASWDNNFKIVKALLEKKSNIDAHEKNSFSALFLTSDPKIVSLLLNYQADPNIFFQYQGMKADLTALVYAIMSGHTQKAIMLINAGANLNTQTTFKEKNITVQYTPLEAAAIQPNYDLVWNLLKARAKVTPEIINDAIIRSKTDQNYLPVAELLSYFDLFKNINPQKTDKKGQTLLHLLDKEADSVRMLDALILHGLNPNIQDIIGQSPLHMAVINQNQSIVNNLLWHGAKTNIQNKIGYTPLHYAAYFDNLPIARLLIQYGANPNVFDNQNRTPLDIAENMDSEEVKQFLLKTNAKRGNPKPGIIFYDDPDDLYSSPPGTVYPEIVKVKKVIETSYKKKRADEKKSKLPTKPETKTIDELRKKLEAMQLKQKAASIKTSQITTIKKLENTLSVEQLNVELTQLNNQLKKLNQQLIK